MLSLRCRFHRCLDKLVFLIVGEGAPVPQCARQGFVSARHNAVLFDASCMICVPTSQRFKLGAILQSVHAELTRHRWRARRWRARKWRARRWRARRWRCRGPWSQWKRRCCRGWQPLRGGGRLILMIRHGTIFNHHPPRPHARSRSQPSARWWQTQHLHGIAH